MKTIKLLNSLITIVFFALLSFLGLCILLWISIILFQDSLPQSLRSFKHFFRYFFYWDSKASLSWEITSVISHYTIVLNYILFTVSIFFLRKAITPFINSNFYSNQVIKNLKISGRLFVFIGLITVIIQCVKFIAIQNMLPFPYSKHITSSIYIFGEVIDLKSTFLIIIGLFFLLISKAFENAKQLKLENDLTI